MTKLAQLFDQRDTPIRSEIVGTQGPANFQSLVGKVLEIIYLLIPLAASLALLAFLWGLTRFIMNLNGDAKAVGEGKNLMKWGLAAMFVMVSLWGILRFFSDEFGFSGFGLPLLPE